MITPLDIQNKEFKKSLIGYNTREVDTYLDSINDDYEKLYRENIELKDKIGILTDQIRQYNNLEETLKSTLVIAQSTADDVTSAARKKAELIIEDAEIQAKNRTNEALNEVRNIMKEYDYLKKEIFIFKTRYESFIKAQLISIEEFYKDYENKNQAKNIDVDEESIDENLDEIDHLGA
ncbi:DivIVA domain-containing protein [Tissierella carlieri]|uniref:DivIVA domain-containing protein n=1 Tax=Tissierella carlieri TaxID=689904 RepID=A0ABT1S5X4_9FIRM|nr:DivIVA domain-containing protein [Tissierella carlieri]MBU5314160.1 DivIVA domain-containing protein [Tissierella carlieri]MCQ4921860.1 DivIVA domain-containing protein [Tissierella carlieri]